MGKRGSPRGDGNGDLEQMALDWQEHDEWVDPEVQCSKCDAVCCRLTVIVMPEDRVPRGYVAIDDYGMEVMARGEDGWCIALDSQRMCCSIYELRPQACERFVMGAGNCRDEREAYRTHYPGTIDHVLIDSE